MSVQDVVKEVKKLSTQKASRSTDIPVKILKENADIFGSYICYFFQRLCRKRTFSLNWQKLVDDVINGLQVSAEKLFKWFSDNQMKGNTDKCHLVMST